MKKNLNIWQRLLAFAMVCVMIVGYLPVFAAAEGEGAGVAIDGFTVKVVCTALAEKTVEMVPTDIPVLDDEGNQKMDENGQPLYEMKETEVYNITGYECTPKYNDYEGMVLTYGPDGYTFTYQGKKLKVEHTHIQEVTQEVTTVEESYEWAATIQPWADIPACKAIAAPVIQLSEGASFETEPVWTITDANGNTVNVGDEAKVEMDTLTAKTTINGKEYTQTAKVTYAAAEYTFSHTSGWYAEMPEVTVTAITENPVEQIAPVVVDGTICEWVKDEITGNYIVTIPAEEGETSKTISVVGKETHTLNVDNTELSISNLRAVAHKEKTLVKFTYVAGNSGADANINGASVKLDPALDGKHYEYYIEDVVDTVDVKLTNIMGKEASATCNVVPYPTVTHSGIIGFKDQVAYVAKNDANIIFTMNNAHGNVEWTVLSGSTDAGFAQVDEQGHSIRVPVSAETPFLDGLNATGTDAGGRTVGDGIGAVAVDLTAPEVTITGLQTTEKTYVNENQTYTVAVSDDIAMSGAVARYYLENDNLGTEFDVAEGFTITDGMHLRKVEVKATDVSGNETVEIMETNVEVDTTAPVLSATISAYVKDENGEYTVPANATAIYSSGDKSFLKFDKVESTEIDGSIKVIVKFTADEKNIPADSEWADGEKTVEMIIPEKTVQEFAISGITLKDKAGNVPTGEVGIAIGGADSETKLHLNLSAGVYNGSIYIDRRTPTDNETLDTEVPTITLKAADTTNYEMVGEKRIFQGPTASFNVAVKDDSGLDLTVTAEVVGEGVSVPATVSLKEDGTGVINISIAEGAETTECTVIATVTDKAGNYFVYMENFGVDYKAPVVTIPKLPTGIQNASATIEFTVAEPVFGNEWITSATIAYQKETFNTKTGEWIANELTVQDLLTNNKITVGNGERLVDDDVTIVAIDRLENKYTNTFAIDLVVDTTKPVVTIVEVSETNIVNATWNDTNVEFHDNPVTYELSIEDIFRNQAYAQAEFTFDDGTVKSVDFLDGAKTVTIEDGKVLTNVSVKAYDTAGNPAKVIGKFINSEVDGSTFTANDGVQIAVDATAPSYTVSKSGALYQRLNTEGAPIEEGVAAKEYYSTDVEYTITINDKFLNEAYENAKVEVKIKGKDSVDVYTFAPESEESSPLSAHDSYKATFTLHDAEMESFSIIANDLIGHGLQDTVADDDVTVSEGVAKYVGPAIIADTTKPTITGTISAVDKKNNPVNILAYKNFNEGDKYYLEFTPVESNKSEVNGTVTVTTTFTMHDTNPDANKMKVYGWTEANGVWTKSYTKEVSEGKTDVLEISGLKAIDYSGNMADATIDLETGTEESLSNILSIDASEDAEYNKLIYIDRATPFHDVDKQELEITANKQAVQIVSGGKNVPVYPGNSVEFTVAYRDDDGGSGLNTTITANATNAKVQSNDGFVDGKANIVVGFDNDDENNDITLNLEIRDNIGNVYYYNYHFGLDGLDPRVSVTFVDHAEAQNKFYYKNNREAIVTVEDLNFDPASAGAVAIKSTGDSGNGKWSSDGIKDSITYNFHTDNDCSFIVESITDLLGNTTTDAGGAGIDSVKYTEGDNHAEFVIDKTAPKINVTYNPAAASGRDGNGVNYYDKIQNVTATITEHNFTTAAEDGAGVFTTVNPANGPKFGAWSQGGDEHVSHITFPEGNLYSFSIDCTDLAGNKAVGYESQTFSVDTTAPTIEITKGDLKNDGLNIVQDDLDLGFTIHDEQKNLSDYKVTVTQLNNEFNKIEVSGSEYYTITEQEDRTTVVVNFKAIAQEKLNDGLYTVEITAKDYAGNTVKLTPDLVFSLNRFGSTFMTDDEYTLEFLALGTDGNVYHREVEDKLIIHEINPNKVWNDSSKKAEGSVLTVIVNGTSTKLVEGKDYKMTVTEQGSGDSRWYVYTYEIDPETFEMDDALVDGRYSILISGEDDAGNKNTNQSDDYGKLQKDAEGEYNGKIEFVLDTTAPIITTAGIESGKNYDAEAQKLEIFLSDSTPSAITVYLNGELVNLSEMVEGLAENAQWLVYDEESNSYILNVPEMNTLFSGQEIRIVVIDAAGNEAELIINDFSVSTNVFVRLLNSTWFIVSLIVLIILIVLAILLKLKKRKVHAA